MSVAPAEGKAEKQPAVVDSTVCGGQLQFELSIIRPSSHVEELRAPLTGGVHSLCISAAGRRAPVADVAFHPSFSRSIACRAPPPTETMKRRPAAGRPLASRNENGANSRIFRREETFVPSTAASLPVCIGLYLRRSRTATDAPHRRWTH